MKHGDGQNWTFSFALAFGRRNWRGCTSHSLLEIGRDRPDEVIGSFEENIQESNRRIGRCKLGNLIVIANKYNIPLGGSVQCP